MSHSFTDTMRLGLQGIFKHIDPKFYRSDFFNAIWRPLDLWHGLDIEIYENGIPAGAMILFRERQQRPFSTEEEQVLYMLAPYIVHAVKGRRVEHETFVDSEDAGLIILDGTGKTLHLSMRAKQLLQFASLPQINRVSIRTDTNLPSAVVQLCHNLRAIAQAKYAPPPVAHLTNPWGRFMFRAYWLDPTETSATANIGITVTRQEPMQLRILRNMRDLGLSARQREICQLLLQGHSHTAIAQQLHLSPHTVVDYVRKLYEKLDVHSHEALLRKLQGL